MAARETPTEKAVPGRARRRSSTKAASSTGAASVIMQARVDGEFARELVERDAVLLGLNGPSDLVREGLRMVHQRANEMAMAAAYDEFYDEEPAPLPVGVASAKAP